MGAVCFLGGVYLAFCLVNFLARWRRKDPGRDLARLLVQWQQEDAEYRRQVREMHAQVVREANERILRWIEDVYRENAEIRRRVYDTYRQYAQNWSTDQAIRNRQNDYWYTSVRLFLYEPNVPRPQPRREIEEKVDWVHEGF